MYDADPWPFEEIETKTSMVSWSFTVKLGLRPLLAQSSHGPWFLPTKEYRSCGTCHLHNYLGTNTDTVLMFAGASMLVGPSLRICTRT